MFAILLIPPPHFSKNYKIMSIGHRLSKILSEKWITEIVVECESYG